MNFVFNGLKSSLSNNLELEEPCSLEACFIRIHCACQSQKKDLKNPCLGDFSYFNTNIKITNLKGILKVKNMILMNYFYCFS